MKLDINAQKELINRINREAKEYSYQPLDWDVWTVCKKFEWDNNEEDSSPDKLSDIYVPTYQRNLTWDNKKKSKFIESLFLNLPIPFIFLNKTYIEWDEYYDIPFHEIIDGSQRIRTISEFKNNKFKISWIEELKELNWLKYNKLPFSLQRKFLNIPLRVVVFEWLDIEKRKEMFNRINTSSDPLTSMEVRKWTYEGEFYSLLKELSKTEIFNKLAPLSTKKKNRDEWTELILRFFAYVEKFDEYDWNVQDFLNNYMSEKSKYLSHDIIKEEINKTEEKINELYLERRKEFEDYFYRVMKFIEENFPNWFKKSKGAHVAASRVFFESISVWVWLALKEKREDELIVDNITDLFNSKEYQRIITSDWANAKLKFENRINIMKEYLLTWNYDRFTNRDK